MELSSLIVSNNQNINKHLVVVFIGLVFIFDAALITSANEASHIYTVHLGTTQHDDPNLVTDSHHDILGNLLGSKEASRESMIYSYRHGFSGFAASLTPSQARALSEHPDVVHITKSKSMKLMTTRVSEYLGLTPSAPNGLSHETDMGSNAIIGVIDSGIWAGSPSFSDQGLGPIPTRWKGRCVAGEQFNVSSCNKKLIGANYYAEGLQEKHNGNFSYAENKEVKSPLDRIGHGTHCASVAGGSFAPNASFLGQGQGTAKGMAPKARIAAYKVCWNGDECNSPDVLKAIDDAIHDGVDVISMSLGGTTPHNFEIDPTDYSIATFHAVMKGIPVVCSGGNSGPTSETVINIAPWTITVAATTMDRELFTPITLGNNITLLGQEGLYAGQGIGFTELLYFNDLSMEDIDAGKAKGKILFFFQDASSSTEDFVEFAQSKGAAGCILASQPTDMVLRSVADIPFAYIDNEIGMDLLLYIQTTKSPVAKIGTTKTFVGRPSASKVARFSSRGPNTVSPAILKPDIAAPGAFVIGAYPADNGYKMLSGTSMSAPVISGIVALLRQKRPKWSPAAIKSALVTTAFQTDPWGEPIASEGSSRKPADPFDFGGGLVNPGKVSDPGLIYDLGYNDYALYLCSAGYDDISISKLLGRNNTCSSPIPSMLDFNLPSITIPYLSQEVTITRTVTNVGPVNSIYKPVIEAPQGINVKVIPKTLKFGKKTKKITYKIKVSTTHRGNTDYLFGSLTWTDNAGHNVRIPLSVRTRIMNFKI